MARFAALVGLAVVLTFAAGASNPAHAARSGGRVGGTSGFGRSSMSASRSTGFGGASSSSASRSGGWGSSSPTRTYHHTTVVNAGGLGFGGFGFGGFGSPFGFGYGAPVHYAPSAFRTVITIMFVASLAFIAATAIRRAQRGRGGALWAEDDLDDDVDVAAPPVTVAKLQVCLLGMARGLKAQLDALGDSADTSTTEGLHMLLQETVLALLRYPDMWVSASTASDTLRSAAAAERAFGERSVAARSAVKQETLVNAGGAKRRSRMMSAQGGEPDELMVVTVLVAAEGGWALPRIKNAADLRAALTRLGGVTPNNVMAVELLWSPQAEGDSLTHAEAMVDHPDLVPV